MKPRLYKKEGLWRCYTFDGDCYIAGLGWTKQDAYADWSYWRDCGNTGPLSVGERGLAAVHAASEQTGQPL